jgi:hypothetical protein
LENKWEELDEGFWEAELEATRIVEKKIFDKLGENGIELESHDKVPYYIRQQVESRFTPSLDPDI